MSKKVFEATFNLQTPYVGSCKNLVAGKWSIDRSSEQIINPMNGNPIVGMPLTTKHNFQEFIDGLKNCPRYGLHNPYLNVERYQMLGEVCRQASEQLRLLEIEEYFTQLIRRVMPKSYAQCLGEVKIVQKFLANFAGDNPRFLTKGFVVAGDQLGQRSFSMRYPYGGVVIIAPFNFPLEIPALQVIGALITGNRPTVKVDSKVSVVFEEFLRLLHFCGLPLTDVDLIHCSSKVMSSFVLEAEDHIRLLQFTGSSLVANTLSRHLQGKVKLEDAGFDWKILGPDYDANLLDYIAWQADKDAYDASGQKCSATSILFSHKNWSKTLLPNLAALAKRRSLDDGTICPVMTWTTERLLAHIASLLKIPGSHIVFGGDKLKDHNIPDCYGAIEPTSVFVPLGRIKENFELVCTEVFGPIQIITEYDDANLDLVIQFCNQMDQHLTAAVVSNNQQFVEYVLARSVNGVTYHGYKARTTGAPQNHNFCPGGDPRSAGIGSPESILNTWTYERILVQDNGPLSFGWSTPPVA